MATQYLNLDFELVRQSIKDYLRANSNFTDYDFEGSNFSILIDALAYNTFTNSYNTNMVVNESFLQSASLRDNVVKHADDLGYLPRSARSSIAKISFVVTFDNSNNASSLTIKKGPVAVSNVENSNFPFSIIEDTTVPISNLKAIFSQLEIYEGNLISETITVDTTDPDQKFILQNNGIDTTTIRVRVKESSDSNIFTTYNQINSIVDVSSTDPIYIVKEVDNQSYELIFGDGLIGKALENGNVIEVDYIVSDASSANGIQNFVLNAVLQKNDGTIVPSTGIIPSVDQPSIGGSEIESILSIKNYASRYLSSQNRAVTSADYESLIPTIFPKAESAVAYGGETLNPPQYGKVFLSIKPDNSSFLSLFDKQFIQSEIKKYSPVGIDVVVEDLKYLYIELDVNAYYSSNLTSSPSDVQSKIFANLNAYALNSDITRFGGRFKYSRLVSSIDDTDVSITSNVTNVVMRRDLIPIFNSYFSYELCYGNTIFAPQGSSYNVKSTGFTIDKYTDVVYITDVATTSTNGTLVLFRINSNNLPQILESNIGTVDYTNGELFIDSLNITSTVLDSGVVEVECLPSSFDLIGLRDLFLNLSVDDSTVTMIQDEISSGADSSGVDFTSTPQYNKQGYFRT